MYAVKKWCFSSPISLQLASRKPSWDESEKRENLNLFFYSEENAEFFNFMKLYRALQKLQENTEVNFFVYCELKWWKFCFFFVWGNLKRNILVSEMSRNHGDDSKFSYFNCRNCGTLKWKSLNEFFFKEGVKDKKITKMCTFWWSLKF